MNGWYKDTERTGNKLRKIHFNVDFLVRECEINALLTFPQNCFTPIRSDRYILQLTKKLQPSFRKKNPWNNITCIVAMISSTSARAVLVAILLFGVTVFLFSPNHRLETSQGGEEPRPPSLLSKSGKYAAPIPPENNVLVRSSPSTKAGIQPMEDLDLLGESIISFQAENDRLLAVKEGSVVLGGMLKDGAKITTEALNFLLNMNCVYNTPAHVMVGENVEILRYMYALTRIQAYPRGLECSSIDIIQQPSYTSKLPNRIDRLQLAREFQRSAIREIMSETTHLESSVVILADLDLMGYPSSMEVMSHALELSQEQTHDVLCAAGIEKYFEDDEEGYYDTFSTILLPDTFMYPVSGRVIPEMHAEENPKMIISKEFTNVDALKWFKTQGHVNDSNRMRAVPVKSCFGGMALYRASKWLDYSCSYDIRTNFAIYTRYANKFDDRACEHVIFNTCLKNKHHDLSIAVQPSLRTWRRMETKKEKPVVATNYAVMKLPFSQKLFLKTFASRESLEKTVADIDINKSHKPSETKEGGPKKTRRYRSKAGIPVKGSEALNRDLKPYPFEEDLNFDMSFPPTKKGQAKNEKAKKNNPKKKASTGFEILDRQLQDNLPEGGPKKTRRFRLKAGIPVKGSEALNRDLKPYPFDEDLNFDMSFPPAKKGQAKNEKAKKNNPKKKASTGFEILDRQLRDNLPNQGSNVRDQKIWNKLLKGRTPQKGHVQDEWKEARSFSFPSIEERTRYYMGAFYDAEPRFDQELLCNETDFYSDERPDYFGEAWLFDKRHLQERIKYENAPYASDTLRDIIPKLANPDTDTLAMHMGDGRLSYSVPTMTKSRPVDCLGNKSAIILPLNNKRHFVRFVETVLDSDMLWRDKKATLVWRGADTGHGKRAELVNKIINDYPADNVDVGFVEDGLQDKRLEYLVKPRMSLQQQLTNKYLLSLEGNDIATGLKWMLYSNSVVFMPPPTVVSWAMEDQLIPFYHYIPLEPDLSDLYIKLQWARNNDKYCEQISKQATQFMEDLWTSDKAKKDNEEILFKIVERYQANFGSFLLNCSERKKEKEVAGLRQNEGESSRSRLEIAWLMSFPNSGTSYTLEAVRFVSGEAVATNYASETSDGIPIIKDHINGPFWLDDTSDPIDGNDESKLVLTKTHCGLFSKMCSPLRTKREFLAFPDACARRELKDADPYTLDRVKKAIHLIRDPFDNIVSRSRLEMMLGRAKFNISDREGFRLNCIDENANDNNVKTMQLFLSEEMIESVKDIPCSADFLRYALWHNKAFETTADMKIETLVIHYSQYETDFNKTLSQITSFLEITQKFPPPPFLSGKMYSEYYTDEEKEGVRALFKEIASNDTWNELKRYFYEDSSRDLNQDVNNENEENRAVEWHWNHFSDSNSQKRNTRRLLIVQYTGWDKFYLKMTDITEEANKQYARRWNFDYARMNGVVFGNHSSTYARYNKIHILEKLRDFNDVYDAVFLLDSDAVIVDWDFNALDLVKEGALFSAQKVYKDHPSYTWDINAGIMLWNLRHPEFNNVLSLWKAKSISEITSNEKPPSDQRALHYVLREMFSEEERRDKALVNALGTKHFEYQSGTFVKHFTGGGFKKKTPNDRLNFITDTVREVSEKYMGNSLE